jgi:hypothetical protein
MMKTLSDTLGDKAQHPTDREVLVWNRAVSDGDLVT